MKIVSKLSYYNLLTIALRASINMTLKLNFKYFLLVRKLKGMLELRNDLTLRHRYRPIHIREYYLNSTWFVMNDDDEEEQSND